MPCEDMQIYDPRWQELMTHFDEVALTWPSDWRLSGEGWFQALRYFGCGFLKNASAMPAPGVSAYTSGINFCVEHGTYYPLKPLSCA